MLLVVQDIIRRSLAIVAFTLPLLGTNRKRLSLRSCLDQAGYAIAVAIGKKGKNAHFPFGDTAADVEGARSGRSKELPKDIFDMMASYKPYRGGNDLLWSMNKICNSHKHEIITPVAHYCGGAVFNQISFHGGFGAFMCPVWDFVKNEMIIARVAHGATFNYDIKHAFFIAFADINPVKGQPAIPILNQMISIVDSIIAGLETEANRLGIIK
jgi:hypothetical protein